MGSTTLETTLTSIVPADLAWREKARGRAQQLTMPHWALGQILDLAVDLVGMTRRLHVPTSRRKVYVMAADHGVTAEGVSAYPAEVTCQMIRNFVGRGAAINVLSEQAGAHVIVVDMGVVCELTDLLEGGAVLDRRIAPGTQNMAQGPAMTRAQAQAAVEVGITLATDAALTTDLYATGEMGIGNTTASSAIIAVLCGKSPDEVTGCGTGLDEEARVRKARTIERALSVNKPDPADALDVLSKVGGFEIGAIAGVILGAAACQKPVLVDGLISTAAALLAQTLCPASADYMVASHQGAEPGHRVALERLGKRPLLDLGLRLGEGTGAVLAMPLVEAAIRVLTRMATFEDAGVSREHA